MAHIQKMKRNVQLSLYKYYESADYKTRKYIRRASDLKDRAAPAYKKSVQEGRDIIRSAFTKRRKR